MNTTKDTKNTTKDTMLDNVEQQSYGLQKKTYPNSRNICILGGGTVSHVRNHLALTAPAYGNAARAMSFIVGDHIQRENVHEQYMAKTYLTRMANSGRGTIETNEDVSFLVDELIEDPATACIVMNMALCDFRGQIGSIESGKYATRMTSRSHADYQAHIQLRAQEKVVSRIRETHKDIFLVAFKTTCGATPDEQAQAALNLLKTASCNLVMANDTKTRLNMIVTPEMARYGETTNRHTTLRELTSMMFARMDLTFERTT